MLGFPGIPELGHGQRLAERHEDRVVAEALVAATRGGDLSLQDACGRELDAARIEHDQLADVPRAAVALSFELREQPRNAVFGPARGLDAGPSSEGGDLDPRVLPRDPGGSRSRAVARGAP